MEPDAKPDPMAMRHRPLPSVDVALLPHELQAARTRTVLLAVLVVVVIGAGGTALSLRYNWLDGLDADRDTSTPETTAARYAMESPLPAATEAPGGPADPPAADSDPDNDTAQEATEPGGYGAERVVRKFGAAKGFRDALTAAGSSTEESQALVTALEKLVDFRRCQPGHELVFERDPDGDLVLFEYRVSITEIYRVRPNERGVLTGTRVEVPIEVRRLDRGGYISGSLGQALDALGLGRSLAGVFVESFEGRIDFKRQTRAGDNFRLLVDQEYVDGELLRTGTVHAVEYTGERVGTLRAYWFQPSGGKGDYFDAQGVAMHGGWLRTPLRYDHVSSGYNPRRRHPILKRIMPHNGVDYAAASGTTVWSAADGTVTFAGTSGANGNLVAIRHAGGYETFYAHLLRISSGIRAGTVVTQRQPIGAVGSTGRSTGPHLHFALKRNGRFIDPATQLNGPGRPLAASHLPAFKSRVRELDRDLRRVVLAEAPDSTDAEAVDEAEHFHDEADLP